MLGKAVHDPQGREGKTGSVHGLGFLDVETTLISDKTLSLVSGRHLTSGAPLTGYEIHLGKTTGPEK